MYEEPKKKRTWLWVVGGALLLMSGCGCTVCIWFGYSTSSVVDNQLAAREAGIEEAQQYAGRPISECYEVAFGRSEACDGMMAVECSAGPAELLRACVGVADLTDGWCASHTTIATCAQECIDRGRSTADQDATYRCSRACGNLHVTAQQGCRR